METFDSDTYHYQDDDDVIHLSSDDESEEESEDEDQEDEPAPLENDVLVEDLFVALGKDRFLMTRAGKSSADRVRTSIRSLNSSLYALHGVVEKFMTGDFLKYNAVHDGLLTKVQGQYAKQGKDGFEDVQFAERQMKKDSKFVQALGDVMVDMMESYINRRNRRIKNWLKNVAPQTVEDFCESRLQKIQTINLPMSPSQKCIICLDKDANARIVRKCDTCTGHTCSDMDFVTCGECLLKHLFVSSCFLTKSFAKCPHCNAEFCENDIVLCSYSRKRPREEDATPTCQTSSQSPQDPPEAYDHAKRARAEQAVDKN